MAFNTHKTLLSIIILLSFFLIGLLFIYYTEKASNTATYSYGDASYISTTYDGKTTAYGHIYNSNEYTCSSPSLPFGTLVLVINLSNNKSTIVKVVDKGPYIKDVDNLLYPHPTKVLNLSKSAFSSISDLSTGLISIKYKILK